MIPNKQVKPWFTLFFTLIVMGILGLALIAFPKGGLKIGEVSVQFPVAEDFFGLSDTQSDSLEQLQKDIQILFDSIAIEQSIDSTAIQRKLDSLRAVRRSIQVPDLAKLDLHQFFTVLEQAGNRKVRIMHYGDSQIEGDRITSFLRNELQARFGGSGPGLFDVMPVAPRGSINLEYSPNWRRYSGFGRKDSTVKHSRYGPLMAFSRFAPIPDTLTAVDTTQLNAWITLRKPTASYSRTRNYNLLKLFLSNPDKPVKYEISADGVPVKSEILPVANTLQIIEIRFDQTPEEISLQFNGISSPDVYALSLESNLGVIVDNIPLRGSSGTIFAKQNYETLGAAYRNLAPDLILLEFGGNVIPYIEDEKESSDYGNWFKSQIKFLKNLNPKSAFLVIGPADTSIKVQTEFITHPMLEPVRDALYKAAMETGCMYFDMYEVMGGKNTMPKWVSADPPLAAPDYIHFSRLGAQKMAEILVEKLMDRYTEFKNAPVVNRSSDSIENLSQHEKNP